MHVPIPGAPRRRARRALLAAALPAVLAAVTLPSVAQAASVGAGTSGQAFVFDRGVFGGNPAETNRVKVEVVGPSLVVTDSAGITTEHQGNGGTCLRVTTVEARCPLIGLTNVAVNMGFGNDTVEYAAPHRASISGGEDADTFFGGLRSARSGIPIEPVTYSGGPGHDKVSYAGADRGVSVTPEDNLANDGRPGGIDRENVDTTFEEFIGSNFDDAPLFGTPGPDVMSGLGGRDSLGGGGGDDQFISTTGDGADDYHGGPGRDTMDYSSRSQPLTVLLDNVANDGAAGEQDQVRSNVENVIGGSAADTLRSFGAFSRLEGRGDRDTLIGDGGPDTLIGGAKVDRLEAGAGNDVIDSLDGETENVDCGSGDDDTLLRDFDGFVGCENFAIGVLRLTPKAITATAGKAAGVRLSWRHPESWRKLRSIELRLYRDGAPVGEVAIHPRAQRISANGAVKLVRKASRLTRKGKTVTARLAVQVDDSLAGQTLNAEVEATNQRGSRQLERRAGTVRVAR